MIELDENFSLEEYNQKTNGHYLSLLCEDIKLKGYIFSAGRQYIVARNAEYIGYLRLDDNIHYLDSCNITFLLDCVNRNRGVGTILFPLVANYLVKNYDQLILEVSMMNKPIMKLAEKAGFCISLDLSEKFLLEDYKYIPFVRKRR